ncbi:hypothetical protein HPB51_004741 [Rhipicephalus microplus]|uniref:Uncharacterized protein n=1 Tax=Rhipicephalus microplus TaxID=6941 RepID=A0A9J6DTJ3_RHIMP|nr:hypothetical protein HPB51_004741 [Rhipicephalus microplus]
MERDSVMKYDQQAHVSVLLPRNRAPLTSPSHSLVKPLCSMDASIEWREDCIELATVVVPTIIIIIFAHSNNKAHICVGILYGIAGTVSNASGFLAPMVVGMVTSPMPTLDNWATVFYLTSGIFLLGALAFLVFGSAELQPWAKPPPPLETVATHIEHQHADGAHRFDLTTSFAESFHMF